MMSKNKQYIFILLVYLVFSYFLNCNMLFYKKNEPYPNFSFIEDNTFAEIYLRWEEKMEHPLSGTTKKRNYQTEIYISKFNFENNQLKKVSQSQPIVFDFWIIPESVYVINTKRLTYLFLYGEKNQPYGMENTFGMYFINGKSTKQIVSSSNVISIMDVIYFLPSPDKENIFLLNKKNKIQIYKILENEIKLIQEIQLSFSFNDERYVSWDPKNFNQIYLYTTNNVYVYNIANNTINIAKTFPECINPGTSFGGSIDLNGNEFMFEQTKKEYYYIKLKNYKSFYKKNFIQNPRQVQFSCFE